MRLAAPVIQTSYSSLAPHRTVRRASVCAARYGPNAWPTPSIPGPNGELGGEDPGGGAAPSCVGVPTSSRGARYWRPHGTATSASSRRLSPLSTRQASPLATACLTGRRHQRCSASESCSEVAQRGEVPYVDRACRDLGDRDLGMRR